MSDDGNPLVQRVDALLRGKTPKGDVPVLTEIVQDENAPARLGPEVERVIEEKLARTLQQFLGNSLDGVRSELTGSVTQMVREAVAASVAHALSLPKRD